MPYIFGKLWHLAIIWAIRKAFQCILQGVRFLLANHTRLSPTSDNDSYETRVYPFTICKTHDKHKKFLLSIYDDNGIDDADDHEGIMEAGCTDQGSCISSLLSLSYLSE